MQEKKRIRWIHILAKGVITLPKKFREKVGIKDGDVVKGWVDKGKIILEPEQKEGSQGAEGTQGTEGKNETRERDSEEWVTFEKKDNKY